LYAADAAQRQKVHYFFTKNSGLSTLRAPEFCPASLYVCYATADGLDDLKTDPSMFKTAASGRRWGTLVTSADALVGVHGTLMAENWHSMTATSYRDIGAVLARI